MASIFTTPPPRRPPPPKYPLFTSKPFSTKSFGPGHILGAGILVFGVVGITKLFLTRTRQPSSPQHPALTSSPQHPALASVPNERGTYGRPQ